MGVPKADGKVAQEGTGASNQVQAGKEGGEKGREPESKLEMWPQTQVRADQGVLERGAAGNKEERAAG